MARKTQAANAYQLEYAEKEAKALRLRVAGYTCAQIAQELGYADASGALKAIKAGIRRACLLPAEELRSVQVARYEQLILMLLGQVLPPEDLPKGAPFVPSLKALDRLLKVFQQLEGVAGLNITKLAPTNPGGDKPYQPFSPGTDYAASIYTILEQAGIIKPGASEGSDPAAE